MHARHREPYAPFVHAPDLIVPSHPFGIYTPGSILEPLGAISKGVRRPYDDEYEEKEEEEDLMNDQTDDEMLDVELAGEALLDAVDARAGVAYKAGVWHDLRGVMRTRRRKSEVEEGHGRTRKRKRRKIVVRPALEDALKSPGGVKVKCPAIN